VVVHVDKDSALSWSVDDVLNHYHKLYKSTLLTQKYLRDEELNPSESISFAETVEIYRARLYDIIWFMRDLNEYIARQANKEDDCTGRFYSLPSMALTLRAMESCSNLFQIN
jgi:hypothetical protein